jgi:hypothetical protein
MKMRGLPIAQPLLLNNERVARLPICANALSTQPQLQLFFPPCTYAALLLDFGGLGRRIRGTPNSGSFLTDFALTSGAVAVDNPSWIDAVGLRKYQLHGLVRRMAARLSTTSPTANTGLS